MTRPISARAILAAFCAFLPAIAPGSAAASGFLVVNTSDAGEGSLRQAIFDANAIPGANTITFAGSTFTDGVTPDIINLGSQLPEIKGTLTLTGPGADKLTLRRPAAASSSYRILAVSEGAVVSLSGVTITGGKTTDFGGGINNAGDLTVTHCAVVGNQAGAGGGLWNDSNLTVLNTTFSGNSASFGGGLCSSTTSEFAGQPAPTIIANSTFSGNSAAAGGLGGGFFNDLGLTELVNCTITGNTTGGVATQGDVTSLTRFANTLVVGNSKGDVNFVLGNANTNVSLGGNLIGTGNSGGNFSGETTTVAANLILNPTLSANGGQTLTHALVSGSPALNAGRAANAINPIDGTPLTTDQRGAGFSRSISKTVDVGAFEQQKWLSILADAANKPEGSSGGNTPFTFTVSRIGGTIGPVTVSYAVTGAANAADFGGTLPSGTVTIPDNSASATVTINVSQDSTREPDEAFTVTLSNPSAGHAIATATASTIITNDDTTTTLASSANPSVAGQALTLTATVDAGSGTATGTVTFQVGTNTLGTGTLVAGKAAFSIGSFILGVGSHDITATYNGDATFGGSVSGTLAQVVNKANTTTALGSSGSPTEPGQGVTFTATVGPVAPGAGTATGTVTFMDGTAPLGTVSLNAGGVATLNTSTLTTATHIITAGYNGDANSNTSTSGNVTQIVGPKVITANSGNNQSATVTTAFGNPLQVLVVDAANTPITGVAVTFTAPGSGASGIFTGGITAVTNGSGIATAPAFTANTTPGSYTVAASVAGGAAPADFTLTNIPGAATHFLVTAPAVTTAGVTMGYTVAAKDAFENTATGYAGTVQFTSTDISATLPADSTLSRGIGTFSVILRTSGNRTIAATDTVTPSISGSSGTVTVSPAAATNFTFLAPSKNAIAGEPFQLTVTAIDPFGNTATSYPGTVHLTCSDPHSTLPADSTFKAGVKSYSIIFATGGSQSVTFTDTVNSSLANSTTAIVSPRADLAIEINGTPTTAPKGSNVIYEVTLINHGPSDATAPAASLTLPAQMSFVSVGKPAGWTAATPPVGSSGAVDFSAASLANGAVVSFTVVAQVTPSTPTATVLTATAAAGATTVDPVSSGNTDSTTLTVGTTTLTGIQPVTTGIVVSPQTGLFDVTVNVTNTTPLPINGFRLHVDFSAYKAASPSLRLYNASSPAGASDAYIDYPFPVAVDGMVPVKLSFYTSTRTFPSPFKPTITMDILPTSQVGDTNGSGVQPRLVKLENGTVLLEFPCTAGRWYRVRFSPDLVHWQDCPVPLQASGNRMQWIDSGAPFTDVSPALVKSRFYTVNEIAAP